jgi:hypothetical protein
MYELTYVYTAESKRVRQEVEYARKKFRPSPTAAAAEETEDAAMDEPTVIRTYNNISNQEVFGPVEKPLVRRSKKAGWKLVYIPKLSFEKLSITCKHSHQNIESS